MHKHRGRLLAKQIESPNAVKSSSGVGAVAGSGVSVKEYGDGVAKKTVFTFTNFQITLTKNGTTSGGAGVKIYDFPEGLILPKGGSSNLVVTNAGGDGSFVMSLGTAAAGTDGTLTSTEADLAPSTAATVSSNTGTCKMKTTSSSPAAGSPLDGSGTAKDMYFNAALNADATGKETLVVNGTLEYNWEHLGDN